MLWNKLIELIIDKLSDLNEAKIFGIFEVIYYQCFKLLLILSIQFEEDCERNKLDSIDLQKFI